MIEVNDVVSVVTIAGEYVGKFIGYTEGGVSIKSPRMVVHAEEGLGFAKGICVTGVADCPEVVFKDGGTVLITP